MDLIQIIIKLEPKENYNVYKIKQDNFYNLYFFYSRPDVSLGIWLEKRDSVKSEGLSVMERIGVLNIIFEVTGRKAAHLHIGDRHIVLIVS